MLLVGVLPLVYLAAASMAVVFGHVTHARARQLPPDLIRDWMADIGLVLGYIGLLVAGVGVCGYLLNFMAQLGQTG